VVFRFVSEKGIKKCKSRRIWTAGQRKVPQRNSEYVWKLKLAKRSKYYIHQIMPYQNWGRHYPHFYDSNGKCIALTVEDNADWREVSCTEKHCSLCEVVV